MIDPKKTNSQTPNLLTDEVLFEIKERYLESIPEIEYGLLFFFPIIYWVMGVLTLTDQLTTVACLIGMIFFNILEFIIPLMYFGSSARKDLEVIDRMRIQKSSDYWQFIKDRFRVNESRGFKSDAWYVKNYVRSRALLGVQRFPKRVGVVGMVFCSVCIFFA